MKIDHKTLNALKAWDYFSMSRNFQSRVWEACGGAPIVAAMIYAERMGANQARVLKYANSGDVTGDHSRVVGYSADVFVKAPAGTAAETPFSLSEQEKSELLALARKSVEHVVQKGELYEPPASASAALNQERGAFVTLTESGDAARMHRLHLRGQAALHDRARHGHAGRSARSALPAGHRPRSCRSSNMKSPCSRLCAA